MNGYSYLEDTQELKLEPFRGFYQALAKAKLENYQDSIKLNDFIKPTEIVEINNIINQKLADKSVTTLWFIILLQLLTPLQHIKLMH